MHCFHQLFSLLKFFFRNYTAQRKIHQQVLFVSCFLDKRLAKFEVNLTFSYDVRNGLTILEILSACDDINRPFSNLVLAYMR
jgi:hypothetical protein